MIKEKAFAKINLFLNVINKRSDGFHDLEMVMASIELHDKLSFEANSTGKISVISNVEITNKEEDNIVYKVASFLQEEFKISKGVKIDIQKNIPLSAGLAGGSADAAATFRGLNKLWKLNLTLDDMAKLSEHLGSDIPFCIYNKLCIAKRKGEDLLFLKHKLKTPILLINPNIKISTKDVFDNVKPEHLLDVKINGMTSAIYNKNNELMARELFNSLEKVVFEMEPTIKEIKHQMIDLGLDGVVMSGSGATIIGMSKDKEKLNNVYKIMNDNYFKLLTKIR